MRTTHWTIVTLCLTAVLGAGLVSCSSTPEVKQQRYAKLRSERDFEYEFPQVWKAIEATFAKMKVISRDPDKMDALELKKASERTLETDWTYTLSRDKYQEYKINNLPKKQYLQTRVRVIVQAERIMGGVRVSVQMKEELERLKADGSSDGYSGVSDAEIDTSRTFEVLDRIQQNLLSAAP